MLIGMTGASGFLGRPLSDHLKKAGHTVVPIPREPGRLPSVDALIHLGGESIAGRWTRRKRRAILASRVEGTRRLVRRLGDLERRPAVFLSASGAGIYGDRPGEILTEDSSPGHGFRTTVCLAWEAEARRAEALGIRTVLLRFGTILDRSGGYLGKVLPWFRRGACLVLGKDGDRFPWVGLGDAIRFVQFCLERPVSGPFNVVSPETLTQGEFALLLAASLGHRILGRIPGGALRLALGELSRALLDRQDISPARAVRHGFDFRQTLLEACLGPARPLTGANSRGVY
jgi:uncharacterized protein (TIGR01777 family)